MKFFFSLARVLIIIIGSLMVAHTASAQIWTAQNTGISSFIFPIKAVDKNTVWAGSENGIYLRTTDGGTNWTSGTVPGAESINFLSIAAIDSDTAYFAGGSFSAIDTRIYKTTDGGVSWKLQYRNTSAAAFINSIAFWDETHGIAVSDPVDGTFVILTTTNGGANWIQTPAANIPPPLSGEFAGFGDGGGTPLAVAGSRHAWFGTGYGIVSNAPIRVFRSTDQGQTWTVANTALANDGQFHGISSMAFKDTLTGFAGGLGTANTGNTLATTTDGGRTWTNVSNFVQTQSQVRTLVYVPNTAFQVLVATTLGGIVYSEDGGTTWMSLSSDVFVGLSFVSPTIGWAGDPNGVIAKFNGDLSTAVAERRFNLPYNFSLSQNYPNPFNPSTTISFFLPSSQLVTLKVYDPYGREVETLMRGRIAAGSYEISFDGSKLTSGIYLYRLQAGEYVETKKMILVK
ncbi:MAG: T9SS type A sorting domain-containing protein [bacterium]